MLQIFYRELISSHLFQKKGYKFYLNLLFSLLWIFILVGLLAYFYNIFYDKLNVFSGFNKSFIVIIVSVISLLISLYLVKDVNKAYFKNKNERVLLLSKPIDIYNILFGKLFYIYLKALFYNILSIFVIFCIYGVKLDYNSLYYLYNIISIVVLTFLEIGLSLLFSICFKYVYNLIKKNNILFIVSIIIISFSLALIYYFILKGFVNVIRLDNINSLFNTTSINNITNIAKNIYPIYQMLNLSLGFSKGINSLIIVGICFGVFVVGVILFRIYYKHYLLNDYVKSKGQILEHNIKITSSNMALIKKELYLAFNSSDGIFSYLSLILIEPLLIYAVISGVNLIFSTGNLNYFRYLYPNTFLSIDAILIILFISVINSSSSIALDKEKSMLIKLKVFPISSFKQLSIKLIVPYVISSIFYLISLVVLIITNEISLLSFGFLLIIGLVTLAIVNISSLYTDLMTKSSIFSLLLDFILPIFYILIAFIVSLLVDISELYYYLIIIGLEVVTLFFLLINYRKKLNKGFLNHEVSV